MTTLLLAEQASESGEANPRVRDHCRRHHAGGLFGVPEPGARCTDRSSGTTDQPGSTAIISEYAALADLPQAIDHTEVIIGGLERGRARLGG